MRNRRIGTRVRIDDAAIDWLPLVPRKGFRKERPQRATVLDISMTGALVRAKADWRIVPGTHVEIATRAGRGVTGVRRIQQIDGDWSTYGIHFLSLEPGLQQMVNEAASPTQSDETEWRWRSAH